MAVDIRARYRASGQAGGANWLNVALLCAILVVVGMALWPVTAGDALHPGAACLSNVKQLAAGLVIYASDHDDRLPPARAWMDCIVAGGARADALRCPEVVKDHPDGYGYAVNRALVGGNVGTIDAADTVPLVFESVLLKRNACTGFYGLPNPGRHAGRNSVAFLDGHAKGLGPRGAD